MLVGPFDRRKKRSRCHGCSTSHLKCSGQLPCTNCDRRRVDCTYPGTQPAATPFILVERGRQQTIANWKAPKKQRQRNQALVSSSSNAAATHEAIAAASLSSAWPLKDDKIRYLHFFDVFVHSNSFNGKGQSFADEIKQLPGFQLAENTHMMDAMLSLGALQAVKLGAPDAAARKATLERALEYYSKSIIGLRDALNTQKEGPAHLRNSVLWSTLFLGLFELTNDATGNGWRQHIIYGTSKALEASGPTACRTGASRRFFMQARVFEICRTISFNEPTFLTRPEWLQMSRDMWSGEGESDWSPLDSLLDVMVMCSNLRVRASNFVDDQEENPDPGPTPISRSISMDGFGLREALESWYASYGQPSLSSRQTPVDVPQKSSSDSTPTTATSTGSNNDSSNSSTTGAEDEADDMILARVFFASISIYLSGVYDYEIIHWRRIGLSAPVLAEATVQAHVRVILELTEIALDKTTLSPLLFTFPLRIAGARARRQSQRDCILTLMGRIQSGFAVAAAILGDLATVWAAFPVISDDSDLDAVEPVPPLVTELPD